ncbi:MAG: succinylglutamate desuccinylase/aspartoacylase family protein [Massilia sp.]
MHAHRHQISRPESGGNYQLSSFHYGKPGSGKKVYIQAALHADEVPGMLVAQFLRTALAAAESDGSLQGEVILVPAANPLGLAQAIHGAPFGRFDLSTGTNFNRAYKHVAEDLKISLAGKLGADPQANTALVREHARASIADWAPATDAEALKKILLGMAIDADIVLDLHCDNEAVLHIYTGTPLAEAISPLARLMGAHAVLLALEAGEEPFDEACSRLWWDLAAHFGEATPLPMACLSTTVELRGEMDVNYDLAKQDAAALMGFLAHAGVITGALPPLPEPLGEATPLEGVEPLVAPHHGVLVFTQPLGARLEAGATVADLIDPVSGAVTPIRTTVPGVFFARTAHRHLLRGMAVGKIAGAKAFRAGKLLSQ